MPLVPSPAVFVLSALVGTMRVVDKTPVPVSVTEQRYQPFPYDTIDPTHPACCVPIVPFDKLNQTPPTAALGVIKAQLHSLAFKKAENVWLPVSVVFWDILPVVTPELIISLSPVTVPFGDVVAFTETVALIADQEVPKSSL